MRQFRALLALCLSAWLSTTATVQAQLTCDAPLATPLGVSQTATLLSFPAYQASHPCFGVQTIQHAIYHSFTAPSEGWYSFELVPTDSVAWRPRLAILADCAAPQADAYAIENQGYPLCDSGDSNFRSFTQATVRLLAGETKIIVVGGESQNDAGSARLRISSIGDTLMHGAQPLQLGSTQYVTSPGDPQVPVAGSCNTIPNGAIPSAVRFTFTPPKPGSYRISFCGSARQIVAISTTPDPTASSTTHSQDGCPNQGVRITRTLDAGHTYYIAAGGWYEWDECSTRTATVEYIDPCPGDLNNSGDVDAADLSLLLTGWGTADADITGDGVANGVDLAILIAMWGACPEG
jgi:hypothetical protein